MWQKPYSVGRELRKTRTNGNDAADNFPPSLPAASPTETRQTVFR